MVARSRIPKWKGASRMYCSNCYRLTDDKKCPICGSRNLQEPAPTDYCFLIDKELIWATALEDLLKDNGIPFVTKNNLGAGLAAKIGPALERKQFYVPYADYANAKALEEEFFAFDFVFKE